MSIYKFILSVPILGTIVYIANSYVYGGDAAAVSKFAGPWLWIKALFFPLLIACALSAIVLWPLTVELYEHHRLSSCELTAFAKAPGDLIASLIPNLLGFGIGVYALIFALAGPIVRDLSDSIDKLKKANLKKHGSALVINSDLAYPLTVLVISLVIGVFQKGNDSVELIVFSWIVFWYAIVVTFEVIGVLFGLGDHALLEKLDSSGSEDAGLQSADPKIAQQLSEKK